MEIIDTYLTISVPTEGLFKEKGSKFLAFAYPVVSEQEIIDYQKELRKKYYDARHQAYAFRLGAEKNFFRASDDGEPTNSSGQPILGQIRSHDLTNLLLVVVRYFGGTKLGIPGLINAYKYAAADAIKNAEIIEKYVNDRIEIVFKYAQMNEIMRIVKDENLVIESQKFDLDSSLIIGIRKSQTERVISRFKKIIGTDLKFIR
jgi:uncharacterized YigZ family protein